jgi:chemotaxis protein methyltransferase CheR
MISQEGMDYIRRWAKDTMAVDISPDKRYLIESRLLPIVRKHSLENIDLLVKKLQLSRPIDPLFQDVLDALTTHETSFFRDGHPFEFIRTKLIPSMMVANQKTKRLAIWSAACSTGQEIYSFAMVLDKYFPQLKTWDIKLIATDISPQVVEKGKSGIYTTGEISRGLPLDLKNRYFKKVDALNWQIDEEIRRKVEFKTLNLVDSWPAWAPFHVIFMRNVLIYFDVPTKQKILNKLKVYLQSGGVLFLGSSETTINIDQDWRVQSSGNSAHYQLKTP